MEKSNVGLLINAEPFGFGPTAAIACFFPHLRNQFHRVGYIGKHHTLDLQKHLAYDSIYDSSTMSDEEIQGVLSNYDVFLTALDFEMATVAHAAGLKVIIYDPLTWYWKHIPKIVRLSDLYLAQDFFGVTQRLKNEHDAFPASSYTVPPIVSGRMPRTAPHSVLINLGGLQNPFWSIEDATTYAQTFITSITGCLTDNEEVVIATSKAVAQRLSDQGARSYSKTEMHEIFRRTKYAFMTPGLGNVYDAAQFSIPTVWLPPANDSQGQQMHLLREHALLDGQIDWTDLGKPIEYFKEQPEVLEHIKAATHTIRPTTELRGRVCYELERVSRREASTTTQLLERFGVDGDRRVSELVWKFCNQIA